MNFVIAIDLEGISGVIGSKNLTLSSDHVQYKFATQQAVREANQAIKALYDCGAKNVYVWDNHGGSLNLDYYELDERVKILAGTGNKHRFSGFEDKDIDGVLLLGYHSKADTANGIIAHTCSSVMYQYIKLNTETVGEIEIDAAMANVMINAPLIFVCSDDKAVKQTKEKMPWVETVISKEALGRNLAILNHPKKVEKEIYSSVKKACSDLKNMKLYYIEEPVTVEMRFMRLEKAEEVYKSKGKEVTLVDPYTIRYTVDSMKNIY